MDDVRLYENSGLAWVGYVYYPHTCYENSCRIHFYFHGCQGTANGMYDGWSDITESGFLQYAASNDMIMVFPQVFNTVSNFGCFNSRTDSNEND